MQENILEGFCTQGSSEKVLLIGWGVLLSARHWDHGLRTRLPPTDSGLVPQDCARRGARLPSTQYSPRCDLLFVDGRGRDRCALFLESRVGSVVADCCTPVLLPAVVVQHARWNGGAGGRQSQLARRNS